MGDRVSQYRHARAADRPADQRTVEKPLRVIVSADPQSVDLDQ
jgi:hypothetical protein